MLKSVLLFAALLFATPASHAFSTRFSCATDHLTTSYAMIEHDSYFELQAWHHNGLDFMPIHQGLITVTDLETLKNDALFLKQISERYVLKFEKSECSVIENDWTCSRLKPLTVNSMAMNSVVFRIYKQKTITRTASSTSYAIRLSLGTSPVAYTLPMEYAERNCVFY